MSALAASAPFGATEEEKLILSDPRAAVRYFFRKANGAGRNWREGHALCELLNRGTGAVLTHIPYLTQESISQGKIRPGSLVRYRGMVQDVFDPEYFVGVVMALVMGWIPSWMAPDASWRSSMDCWNKPLTRLPEFHGADPSVGRPQVDCAESIYGDGSTDTLPLRVFNGL